VQEGNRSPAGGDREIRETLDGNGKGLAKQAEGANKGVFLKVHEKRGRRRLRKQTAKTTREKRGRWWIIYC